MHGEHHVTAPQTNQQYTVLHNATGTNMISVYNLKPRFQNLLRPVCKQLVQIGITANQVTIAAILLSVISGVLIVLYPMNHEILLILPIALFIRMALNAIDGMIAREHNMQTRFGAVLNELGDVVSDVVLYLPLAVIPCFETWLIIIIVILSIISEMTGVLMASFGASRRYDGPMGKSDRAFMFGTIGLLLGIGITAASWLTIVLWILIALLCFTIALRIKRGLVELDSDQSTQNAGSS